MGNPAEINSNSRWPSFFDAALLTSAACGATKTAAAKWLSSPVSSNGIAALSLLNTASLWAFETQDSAIKSLAAITFSTTAASVGVIALAKYTTIAISPYTVAQVGVFNLATKIFIISSSYLVHTTYNYFYPSQKTEKTNEPEEASKTDEPKPADEDEEIRLRRPHQVGNNLQLRPLSRRFHRHSTEGSGLQSLTDQISSYFFPQATKVQTVYGTLHLPSKLVESGKLHIQYGSEKHTANPLISEDLETVLRLLPGRRNRLDELEEILNLVSSSIEGLENQHSVALEQIEKIIVFISLDDKESSDIEVTTTSNDIYKFTFELSEELKNSETAFHQSLSSSNKVFINLDGNTIPLGQLSNLSAANAKKLEDMTKIASSAIRQYFNNNLNQIAEISVFLLDSETPRIEIKDQNNKQFVLKKSDNEITCLQEISVNAKKIYLDKELATYAEENEIVIHCNRDQIRLRESKGSDLKKILDHIEISPFQRFLDAVTKQILDLEDFDEDLEQIEKIDLHIETEKTSASKIQLTIEGEHNKKRCVTIEIPFDAWNMQK